MYRCLTTLSSYASCIFSTEELVINQDVKGLILVVKTVFICQDMAYIYIYIYTTYWQCSYHFIIMITDIYIYIYIYSNYPKKKRPQQAPKVNRLLRTLKTRLWLFSNPPKSSARASGAWRHSHLPVQFLSGIFILTSLNDTSSPRARVNTCAHVAPN